MRSATVTAVVVTYDSSATIGASLASMKGAFDAGRLVECIVVDNLSHDTTVEIVSREHSWCTLVETGENLGFGRGCTVGIARTRTPYVLLLNPDARVPRDGLERLVSFLEATPRAGVAAPAIVQDDGQLQFAGRLPTPGRILLRALGLVDGDSETAITPGAPPARRSWVCGAVVLLRRAMLDETGGFDPRYFLYFEETDLWYRAQRAGWEIWTVGEAVAGHLQAGSTSTTGRAMWEGCIAEHYFESRFHYLAEHFGRPAAVVAELGELGVMAGRAGIRLLRGRDIDRFLMRVRAPILRRPKLRKGSQS